MSQLQTNLTQIYNEKQNKIIPENIKSGVTIFDVVGTHTSGAILNVENENASVSGTTLVLENMLPYIELEYIQSTGTQYISTGVIGTNNIGVDIDYEIVASTQYSTVIGARNGTQSNTNGYVLGTVLNSSITKAYLWKGVQHEEYTGNDIMELNLRTKLISNPNSISMTFTNTNGTKTFSLTNNPGNFSSVQPLYLFATNQGSSNPVVDNANLKLYNCKIYESSELVMNLIPVKRKDDNVICMFDTVSKSYFTNIGTGTFTAGPEVSNS